MSVKSEREKIIRSGAPPSKYSLNQRMLYNAIRMEQKAFGPDKKAAKAERRRWKQEEFLQGLQKLQFNRAVDNIFNGTVSIEDIGDVAADIRYVHNHISEHERVIETFDSEKGTKVSITIVEFTRREASSRWITNSETA